MKILSRNVHQVMNFMPTWLVRGVIEPGIGPSYWLATRQVIVPEMQDNVQMTVLGMPVVAVVVTVIVTVFVKTGHKYHLLDIIATMEVIMINIRETIPNGFRTRVLLGYRYRVVVLVLILVILEHGIMAKIPFAKSAQLGMVQIILDPVVSTHAQILKVYISVSFS